MISMLKLCRGRCGTNGPMGEDEVAKIAYEVIVRVLYLNFITKTMKPNISLIIF